jgi:hypothetical protein
MDYRKAIALADRLAVQTLRRVGLWSDRPEPPRVEDLAQRLGATLHVIPLDVDGCLYASGGDALIYINEAQPGARQNFSVGHELAHWLLVSPRWRSDLTAQVEAAFGSEERLCDALGAALLMPRPWVASQVAGKTRNMLTLQDLARGAGLSLSAALLRLSHVARWPHVLLHWSKIESEWLLDDIAGLPIRQAGLITSTSATAFSLLSLAAEGERLWLGEDLPLLLGAEEATLVADVQIYREGRAAALLRLPGGGEDRPAGCSPAAFPLPA